MRLPKPDMWDTVKMQPAWSLQAVKQIIAACSDVAYAYEPKCDTCPPGVANAIADLARRLPEY